MKPISICMPYWNRQKELDRSLESYAKFYSDLDLEFCVCDDGSTEPVQVNAKKVVITTLPKKAAAKNPCVPLNAAVRSASNEIIVLTNPEIEHREPVLSRMLMELIVGGVNSYVMTGCRNVGNEVWYAGPETRKAPLDGREPIPPGSHLHFCTMFHRSLFERAGGFDESYRNVQGCDDNDWLWRLYDIGAQFRYVPGVVWHHTTRHAWTGTPAQAAEKLRQKWGHLKAFRECV